MSKIEIFEKIQIFVKNPNFRQNLTERRYFPTRSIFKQTENILAYIAMTCAALTRSKIVFNLYTVKQKTKILTNYEIFKNHFFYKIQR